MSSEDVPTPDVSETFRTFRDRFQTVPTRLKICSDTSRTVLTSLKNSFRAVPTRSNTSGKVPTRLEPFWHAFRTVLETFLQFQHVWKGSDTSRTVPDTFRTASKRSNHVWKRSRHVSNCSDRFEPLSKRVQYVRVSNRTCWNVSAQHDLKRSPTRLEPFWHQLSSNRFETGSKHVCKRSYCRLKRLTLNCSWHVSNRFETFQIVLETSDIAQPYSDTFRTSQTSQHVLTRLETFRHFEPFWHGSNRFQTFPHVPTCLETFQHQISNRSDTSRFELYRNVPTHSNKSEYRPWTVLTSLRTVSKRNSNKSANVPTRLKPFWHASNQFQNIPTRSNTSETFRHVSNQVWDRFGHLEHVPTRLETFRHASNRSDTEVPTVPTLSDTSWNVHSDCSDSFKPFQNVPTRLETFRHVSNCSWHKGNVRNVPIVWKLWHVSNRSDTLHFNRFETFQHAWEREQHVSHRPTRSKQVKRSNTSHTSETSPTRPLSDLFQTVSNVSRSNSSGNVPTRLKTALTRFGNRFETFQHVWKRSDNSETFRNVSNRSTQASTVSKRSNTSGYVSTRLEPLGHVSNRLGNVPTIWKRLRHVPEPFWHVLNRIETFQHIWKQVPRLEPDHVSNRFKTFQHVPTRLDTFRHVSNCHVSNRFETSQHVPTRLETFDTFRTVLTRFGTVWNVPTRSNTFGNLDTSRTVLTRFESFPNVPTHVHLETFQNSNYCSDTFRTVSKRSNRHSNWNVPTRPEPLTYFELLETFQQVCKRSDTSKLDTPTVSKHSNTFQHLWKRSDPPNLTHVLLNRIETFQHSNIVWYVPTHPPRTVDFIASNRFKTFSTRLETFDTSASFWHAQTVSKRSKPGNVQ